MHPPPERARPPFLALNAAAVEGLIESELFGHVRGAFTDARDRKRGFFELADRGTLFLDEIAETSHSVQVRLLRALQEREIRPVGADAIIKIDVRIVAMTNRDLRQAMNEGRFREDLYRLNVFRIHLPPLREHKDDIPYLAEYFVRLCRGETAGARASAIRRWDTCSTTTIRETSASSRTRSSAR
ncbi:MAG: sigma 54-interacting transcriptional regulator [Candidatus Eisenbacteria bacterium]